jgi:DAK2 domain fusion protein YloV
VAQILDAPSIVRAMALYARALERFRPEIDSLNVFPVADGDTGSNLLHTQRAVVAALEASGNDAGMRVVRETIATAALAGARGNSGVILSQVLRTLCAVVPDDGADGPALAKALAEAAAAARRAVAEPKDGTVLTVLDGAAAAAQESATTSSSAGAALEAALSGARRALERTTDLLPELRDADVVDAGGKGAVLLLDALRAAVSGDELSEPSGPAGPVGHAADGLSATSSLNFAYEVEFLLEVPEISDLGDLREALAFMGDSLAIVGGDALYRVHIHTDRPDAVLTTAEEVGTVRDASTRSLDEQVADCLGRAARAVQAGGGGGSTETARWALVAVLEPSEVAEAIRSLGAIIVEPASDYQRTAKRISEVLVSAPPRSAVVLVEAAHAHVLVADPRIEEQAAAVVSSLPAAISAAAEFHPDAGPVANVIAMGAAARRCRTAELSAPQPSIDATAKTVTELVVDLAAVAPDAEVLTVVAGADVPEEQLAAVTSALTRRFPELRIETLRGPRSSSTYQVGLE